MKVLRDLEKLNASHETFIYSVSHDLKAPLANIEGLVRLLKQTSNDLLEQCDADKEEQNEIAAMLENSVKTMRNIIEELSEIAKIEGNFKEVVESVRFEDVLTQVELTLKDNILESNASIIYDIREQEIEFSRKNLRSIIYNLLSNAIKYKSTDKDPNIQVKTEALNGFVQISVKDNGLGIAEEKKELIFTPFTRFETNTEGTGIGLYLVKKLVENAGGELIVESKLGEGSEFIVYLKPKA
ncbi:sensor histidine kinase [Pontibacter pamirensis]|uniref:sensor histidine kinase n=1 Tax=Pontibacter pamirensis TaxID=2562824 RepID=UPI0021CE9017|nr:HAMP domain-containing sensor histidine kinase [Pontibacter pamirensis]